MSECPKCDVDGDALVAVIDRNCEKIAKLEASNKELLDIAIKLALATDEGNDAASGTHYVAKDGMIRCKGSFLSLIEAARAAIAKAQP